MEQLNLVTDTQTVQARGQGAKLFFGVSKGYKTKLTLKHKSATKIVFYYTCPFIISMLLIILQGG